MIRKMLLLALIGAAFIVSIAHSQETVPPLSFDRAFLVLGGGYTQFDENVASAIGERDNLTLMPGIGYSSGRSIQFALSETVLKPADLGIFEGGVRWMTVTDGTGQHGQLALGVNAVHYHGPNADLLGGSYWSWNTGIYGSYNIAGKPGKPLRWYLSGAAVHDPNKKVLPSGEPLLSQTRFRIDVRGVVGLKNLFQ